MEKIEELLKTRQATEISFDVEIKGISNVHFDLCNGNDCIND